MFFNNHSFIYILPALIVPVLIYLFTRTTRTKIDFPSNIILDKIVKKRNIKRKNFLRLLLRIAILFFLILTFAKPGIYINKKQKKDLIVDISFSSLKYRDNIKKIIDDMKENNLVNNIYYLDDSLSRNLDQKDIPVTNFKFENRNLIPSEKEFYFISDSSKNLGENVEFVSNIEPISNCSIKKIKTEKNIFLKNESVKFKIYITASEKMNETSLKIKLNNELINKRTIDINKEKVLEFSYILDSSGYKNFKFMLEDDEYIPDNRYYRSIYVYKAEKKYYINRDNNYLENLLEVLKIKKGSLNNSDLYFFIIKDASLEKKIMNIKDYDRMFLFPKKGNMNFLNLPVSYQNTVNNRKNCYFYKNINNSYELERYVKMDIQKGRTLAGNKNFNSIARWNNMFLFNFLPSEDNTNFILKPFVYEKFRNWIYKNKKSNYHLNNKEVLIIKKDFNNIYFNDENINHLIEKNKLKINKLNQTGFLKIHTDKGLIYKSINQYLTEYKNFTGKKDNKKPDLGKTLKIELWKLFLIFSLILFFIETFMFIKERGIFSE